MEPDGRVHHILYGFQGFMLIARDDLIAQAGLKGAPATWVDMLAYAKKAQQPPRSFGLGIPVSNQTDSNVWEDVMKSHGARLADEAGKANVFPPGVTTWDNTMNNSTFQSGKAVFVLNPVTLSLWLEANNPELLAKTGHYTYPRGPKSLIHPVSGGDGESRFGMLQVISEFADMRLDGEPDADPARRDDARCVAGR